MYPSAMIVDKLKKYPEIKESVILKSIFLYLKIDKPSSMQLAMIELKSISPSFSSLKLSTKISSIKRNLMLKYRLKINTLDFSINFSSFNICLLQLKKLEYDWLLK